MCPTRSSPSRQVGKATASLTASEFWPRPKESALDVVLPLESLLEQAKSRWPDRECGTGRDHRAARRGAQADGVFRAAGFPVSLRRPTPRARPRHHRGRGRIFPRPRNQNRGRRCAPCARATAAPPPASPRPSASSAPWPGSWAKALSGATPCSRPAAQDRSI